MKPAAPAVGRAGARPLSPGTLDPAALRPWWGAAVLGVAAYLAWFVWALENGDYDAWGTLIIGPALVLASVPLLRRAVRLESDRRIRQVIVGGFFVKLAMAFVNYGVAVRIYGDVADARGYHGNGARYAEAFRSGQFDLAEQGELGRRFIDAVTGVVYTLTGPSRLGGYLVFAWFGFWGLYLCYRAFVVALPGGDARRYAVLVMLLPSTLFWTSALGKEAWMMLTLGVCALGTARLLTRQRGGLVLVGLGLLGGALCRPHVSVMVLLGVTAAYLFRRAGPRTALGPVATVAGLVVLLSVGGLVAARFSSQFELGSLGAESVQGVFDRAERQSGGGGSAFSTRHLPWPVAVPGVLVRPLPFEARNLQSFLASLEGVALLVLLAVSWRRVWGAVRGAIRHPYLLFCIAYTVMFLAAFSVFRNLGTLARERVMVLPFVLVLLAVPAARRVPGRLSRFGPPPLTR